LITSIRMICQLINIATNTLCGCFNRCRFVTCTSGIVYKHVSRTTTLTNTTRNQISHQFGVLTTDFCFNLVITRVTRFNGINFPLTVQHFDECISQELRFGLSQHCSHLFDQWKRTKSERISPGVILILGNVTLFAECIGEVIPLCTFPNNVTFQFRMCNSDDFPVVTKLGKCLLFGDRHLSGVPLTLIEYTETMPVGRLVDTSINWHTDVSHC